MQQPNAQRIFCSEELSAFSTSCHCPKECASIFQMVEVAWPTWLGYVTTIMQWSLFMWINVLLYISSHPHPLLQLSFPRLCLNQWARTMFSQGIQSHSPSKPREHSPWATNGNGSQLLRAVGVKNGSRVLQSGVVVLPWQSPLHTSLMKGATTVLSATALVAIPLNQLNLVLVRVVTKWNVLFD